jgi:uncharacterized protein (TIGR01244 family)
MTNIKWVTPDFAVAPQPSLADIAEAGQAGFKTLINNRPAAEEPAQPSGQEVEATARAVGLDYHGLPYSGAPPPALVAAMATLLEQAPKPVLAYCRSGMRSILAWALAQAFAGQRRPDEIIALAARAGYDLEPRRQALETLAPPR